MKKKSEIIMAAFCSVMIALLLIVNFAVGTFFRYYSVISVSGEEDYRDVLASLSDEESTAPAYGVIELPEESVFYDFKTFKNLEHVNFKANAKILREFLYNE